MYDNKKEPLNIKSNKLKKKYGIFKNRKKHKKQKKTSNSTFRNLIVAYSLFIFLFCFFGILILNTLVNITNIKTEIKTKYKELKNSNRTKKKLSEKKGVVERMVNITKKEYKKWRNMSNEQIKEYNKEKKIYDDIEGKLNETNEQNITFFYLDEVLINLNNRINKLKK